MRATMLDAGFTTVRNVGSADCDDVGLKQAIDGGYAVGPRIVPAAYALGATGGHCDDTYLPPASRTTRRKKAIADGPRKLRDQVRWPAQIWRRGDQDLRHRRRVLAGDSSAQQQLTEDELKAIADEAHMLGPARRRPRPWRRRHQRRDPRRHRHHRACQPGRRRGDPPRQARTAPGSRWISTTTTIPRPTARRTAPRG